MASQMNSDSSSLTSTISDGKTGGIDKTFFCTFRNRLQELREKLDNIPKSLDHESLGTKFDEVSAEIQILSKYLTDTTPFLPPYDIRSSQTMLADLTREVDAKRRQILPKKKFAFTGRKERSNVVRQHKQPNQQDISVENCGISGVSSQNTKTEQVSTEALPKVTYYGNNEDAVGFENKSGATLTLTRKEATGGDINLSNLTNCTVFIHGAPGVVHACKLKKTTVLCGPVFRSFLIENCSDCVFSMACQQLRVHNTDHTDFYLHVTSRAIIEDCTDVRFAPYTWQYSEIDEDYAVSGLNREKNFWDQVNDFKWIKQSVRSPNWSILPEHERISSWPDIPLSSNGDVS